MKLNKKFNIQWFTLFITITIHARTFWIAFRSKVICVAYTFARILITFHCVWPVTLTLLKTFLSVRSILALQRAISAYITSTAVTKSWKIINDLHTNKLYYDKGRMFIHKILPSLKYILKRSCYLEKKKKKRFRYNHEYNLITKKSFVWKSLILQLT